MRHLKVQQLLEQPELDRLEVFARKPGRTTDECLEWMTSRGHKIGRTAVGNWKKALIGRVKRPRRSGARLDALDANCRRAINELANAIRGPVESPPISAIDAVVWLLRRLAEATGEVK